MVLLVDTLKSVGDRAGLLDVHLALSRNLSIAKSFNLACLDGSMAGLTNTGTQ